MVIWWPLRSPSDSAPAGAGDREALAGSDVLASVERVAGLVADPPGEVPAVHEMREIGEDGGLGPMVIASPASASSRACTLVPVRWGRCRLPLERELGRPYSARLACSRVPAPGPGGKFSEPAAPLVRLSLLHAEACGSFAERAACIAGR
jgi:hypothetical protein